ncbi:MAG: stage II sporulation protein M [Chitinophagaceae bacterium]|nr:stage II sporulation protein M [Chitinophagaceae bacterium]
MREALFIKKNKDRWLKVQHMPPEDPDEMASEFIQLLDDLSYAKSYYPSGKVRRYINAQASKIFLTIYKNRKEETSRIVSFLKYDLPLTIGKHHGAVLFSFCLFVIFFIIGFFTASKDEDLIRQILGDGYVNMTIQNISSGNPFGVYENGEPFFNWLGFMIHNTRIDLAIFTSGVLLAIPSVFILAKNAIMVGVFDQLFYQYGYGLDFWLVVFVHGTLEMTALILSAAAAFVLVRSFLLPGTIRRIDSVKTGAKDGVKIIIGIIPVSAMAALFEAFITRLYNDVPVLTTMVFILSVLFVIWYFIIYPFRMFRRFSLQSREEN